MIKNYFLIPFLIFNCHFLNAQTNLVPNGNLENWADSTTLNDWTTLNDVSQKTTDSYEGNSCASLKISDTNTSLEPEMKVVISMTAGNTYDIFYKINYINPNDYSNIHFSNLKVNKLENGASSNKLNFSLGLSGNSWKNTGFRFNAEESGDYEIIISTYSNNDKGFELLVDQIRVYNAAEVISFPDTNFKNALLNHSPIIDNNRDGEIQYYEANTFDHELNISFKNITDLSGIEEFKDLTKLNCNSNNITNLIIPNTKLTSIKCNYNQISALDLSTSTNLTYLDSGYNQLNALDLSKNTLLETLILTSNEFNTIEVSLLELLTTLDIAENNIASIDLSKNIELESLNCFDNSITTLDLSKSAKLNVINCNMNNLNSLDVSTNLALEDLNCANNNLTSLNLSMNVDLKNINCSYNEITLLDFSQISTLEKIDVTNNELEYLDVANGNNNTITQMYATNNSILFCVQVDDVNYAESNSNWTIASHTGFSQDCSKPIATITEFSSGFSSLIGIGIKSNNHVYVSEYDTGKIYDLNTDGVKKEFSSTGFRTNDIAFNTHNKLFITEPFTGKILKSNNRGELTEIASVPSEAPFGIAFDQENYLNYSSTLNGNVTQINNDNSTTEVANGFSNTKGIAFDSKKNLYVVDSGVKTIFKVSPNGNVSEVVKGYSNMNGIDIINDIVYFTTYTATLNKVIKYDPVKDQTSDYVTTNLDQPVNLEIDNLGNMYVVNSTSVTKIFSEELKPRILNENIVSIPDPIFKQLLLNYSPVIDTNGDGEIQVFEAEAFSGFNGENIEVNNKNIEELTGIEAFINIRILGCRNNKLKELDITSIEGIFQLNCAQNQIQHLDVSNQPYLNFLFCENNELTDLKVENKEYLETFFCSNNELSNLGLSNLPLLKTADLSNNNLKSLDFIDSPSLEKLYCSDNELTSLNVSENNKLITLNCQQNLLTELILPNSTDLKDLYCGRNQITSLDVSKNIALVELFCYENNISGILNIQNNTNIDKLWCWENSITEIDASKNVKLREFICRENQITNLILGNHPILNKIDCSINNIENLDFSNSPVISEIKIFNNNLSSLDLKNGNNENINTLNATGNENLFCIEVDNVSFANSATNWFKDTSANYSENCSATADVNDLEFSNQLLVYPNPVKDIVSITSSSSTTVKNITVFNLLGKEMFSTKNLNFNISNLPTGLYVLKIQGEQNKVAIKKFIKE
ncbi:T9SS type A sorting domain-containing protein [Tenacibaculum sp. 190524A05c]|uniref:T9SS type A sorting domain-containing protein n=1 Tax=Tenacibaculum platacis TaxID=3137852 RepID=UPI0031FB0161